MLVWRSVYVLVAGLICAGFASAAGLSLTADNNPIQFFANAGQTLAQCGANCTQQTNITASDGTSALNFSAVAHTSSGGNWLSVSPGQNKTPATLNVTADPTGLPAGNYAGTITLTCNSGSTCTGLTINVSFGVSGIVLTAAPNQVNLTLSPGQKTTSNVTLTGSANVNVSVISGGTFLSAPASVASPGTLTLTIDATHLTAGPYSGSVQLQCASGGSPCLQVTVSVSLTVMSPATLSAGALSNALSGTAGQSLAQCGATCSASFTLSSSSGSLNYQITPSSTGNWLGASPASGTAGTSGSTITVTANAGSLTANTYMGSLSISCASPSTCSTIQVNVSFTVSAAAPKPTLVPSASSVSFQAFTGRGNPAAQTLTVTASDGSAQSFTVSGVPGWLMVSALSGTTGQASGTLTLTPNASAAPANGATGALILTPSDGAAPTNVGVSISFSAFTVTPNPQQLTISVPSGGTQTGSLSIGTADSGNATVSLAVTGSSAVTVPGGQITVPGNVTVTANASSLQAGANQEATITITCAAANPCTAVTVAVQVTVTAEAAPSIKPSGIVPLYSTATTVQAGSWISIYGSNLANGTYNWKGDFPQSLGGTIVTIDGKDGYLSYVSPTQINVQVPDDSATGTVPVQVISPNGSATSSVTLGQFGPSLSLLGDNKHAAGLIIRTDGSGAYSYPGGTYDIIGPTGNSLGYRTVAAKAGDYIELYGVGFGSTTPAVPAGQAFAGQTKTNNTVTILINNTAVPLPLQYSGLSGAGLYQFNFILPAGLGTGDVPVQAMVGGVATQANVVIALQ